MKFRIKLSIAVICSVAAIIGVSCAHRQYGYNGRHSLNEETVIEHTASEERTAPNRVRNADMYSGPKENIAVMDFSAKDVSPSIALSVSELIRTELINTGRYTVIERSQMKVILKEQGFQQTGCTDVSCAVQIGKLLSAKKMLVGSVMKLGSKLIISGRVVDVEKGIGERGARGNANSLDQLDQGVTEFVNGL